ncbi:MAG TPA: prepilin-type N-terminal cleavage/methylation domain-containing protein [Candidatus Sulfotelmatobacter sp.]|nr:prepilin-type N-terminal cleavage/methylation domain-containing protein [Candidatus Sulfotelmatobacter sp.]
MRPSERSARGFTLIEVLIVVALLGVVTAIAIPNLLSAQLKAKYGRAAAETKTAVTQAILYQNDTARYPGDLVTLRMSGYANVSDKDPWKALYVVSDLFADTATPASTAHAELHVCSTAGAPVSDCTAADLASLPPSVVNGSVGYSATYGAWKGV